MNQLNRRSLLAGSIGIALALPAMAQVPEGERAIVEARAMAETCAAAIETHAGDENRVQEPRTDPFVAFGLDHAEGMLARPRVQPHEAHAARPHAGDAWQKEFAAALAREFDERGGAELLGHRRIQADAFAGGEPARGGDVRGDRPGGLLTRRRPLCFARGQEFFAE